MAEKKPLEKDIKKWLSEIGSDYGFDVFAVSPAELPAQTASYLDDFIKAGFHGEMAWMEDTKERRKSPKSMWKEARTALVFGCNYGPEHNPLEKLNQRQKGNISVYARGRDYHDVLKGRLKQIASQLHARTNWQVKIFVDTAPLMEKPLAAKAGIGWQGKHTNLVSRAYGSWLFLGVILTDGLVPPDQPESDHCGQCRACLDICPTNAFVAPYKLDARRCISYLTIEYDGHIPAEFRQPMQNRIFGCDDCLAVCPWNKFAIACSDQKLTNPAGTKDPDLAYLLCLDDAAFRAYFSKSPVKRSGYVRFIRNVLIAAGNAEDKSLIRHIQPYLEHADGRLRAMAIWALSHYLTSGELAELYSDQEKDKMVLAEWKNALS